MTPGAPSRRPIHRPGRWLPARHHLEAWVSDLSRVVAEKPPVRPHPAVEAFRALIESDPVSRMYVTRMIEEVPQDEAYASHHLRSIDHMLSLINEVIGQAPAFDTTALVGTPLNAILDWSMATPAGFAAFRHPPINTALRNILTAWCEFLTSPASLHVLNASPTGWKSPAARAAMNMDQFEHDPDDKYWGFTSWNDFFTRRFKPGRRPVAEPDNDKVIVSACESTPFKIRVNARRTDTFWLKSQPYSLRDMLAGDKAADAFEGGAIYLAYLSALNYHRWHSPVSGTIREAVIIPGTYYSELEAEGADPVGPNNSQAYITHVATRALILIEADDPVIGLMGVLLVGMGEVSSCVIGPGIAPGRAVRKGEELGYFQFGGSTHCLIFRPGVIAQFAVEALPDWGNPDAPLVRLGTALATAR